MPLVRYGVQYEDYSEHLVSRFGKLLQLQSFVDMTLMCNSHTLRVHKTVLAASSSYFQEILQYQTGEPLVILKMNFSVLKSLVEFMYCGRTNCLEEHLDELVSAAQFLKIKGLSKVTKDGLSTCTQSDLPKFSPPIVVNKKCNRNSPVLAEQVASNQKPVTPSQAEGQANASSCGSPYNISKSSWQDTIYQIPIDIKNTQGPSGCRPSHKEKHMLRSPGNFLRSDHQMMPPMARLKRGRPSVKQKLIRQAEASAPTSKRTGSSSGLLGPATELALQRREEDSRKAIQYLNQLQTIQMKEYMDREALTQAVESIYSPETSDGQQEYLFLDNEIMYIDQSLSSMDHGTSYVEDGANSLNNDSSINFKSTEADNSSIHQCGDPTGINSAMSQYVNVLKTAGLPTDLPIFFQSGDGSYVNVTEQVLLDMAQSNEIQYEVIEQPNIIDRVIQPGESKSIDELSKAIERGEVNINRHRFDSLNNFSRNLQADMNAFEEAHLSGYGNNNVPYSVNAFDEHHNMAHNFVILEQQDMMSGPSTSNDPLSPQNNSEFNTIDGEMRYFTNDSVNEDVRQFYEQHLEQKAMNDIENSNLTDDSHFRMDSSLETSNSLEYSLMSTDTDRSGNPNHFESFTTSNTRAGVDQCCYDFELQLPVDSNPGSLDDPPINPLLTMTANDMPNDKLDNETPNDSDQSLILENICDQEKKVEQRTAKDALPQTLDESSQKGELPVSNDESNGPELPFKTKPVSVAVIFESEAKSNRKEFRQIKKISILPANRPNNTLNNVKKPIGIATAPIDNVKFSGNGETSDLDVNDMSKNIQEAVSSHPDDTSSKSLECKDIFTTSQDTIYSIIDKTLVLHETHSLECQENKEESDPENSNLDVAVSNLASMSNTNEDQNDKVVQRDLVDEQEKDYYDKEDVPFAVGLLPLRTALLMVNSTAEDLPLKSSSHYSIGHKRKSSQQSSKIDENFLIDNLDSKGSKKIKE